MRQNGRYCMSGMAMHKKKTEPAGSLPVGIEGQSMCTRTEDIKQSFIDKKDAPGMEKFYNA
jgi:hypothetical protein